MEHWYTVHTKPHKERQVETVLTTRGIEVYFPVVPAPRRNQRSAQSAFFPCYLFVHADLDTTGLWSLHYAPGVRRVVMFGDHPAKVDDSIIATLRARLVRTDSAYANGDALKRGDRVVITSGPLANMEALFDQSLSPAGRVRILINWLERGTPVELDSTMLRKIRRIPAPNLSIGAGDR
jgi:transcriptional antiterminator RfaH